MVIITDCYKMFWGVTIDAGKRYSQVVDQGFHVSMAALEISAKKPSENVQVMLQHDSSEYLLCTLHNSLMQQPLDLNFATGEQVSFSLNGSGIVHLTGYLIPDDEEEPFGESFSESDDEEAPSLVDTSADESILVGKRKADASLRKSKKLKLSDSYVDDEEDESDEDDEDYNAEEEEFSDDFDDDSFDEEESEDESDLEEDEEESPTKKMKTTTPEKPQKAGSAPNTPAAKKIKVKQELNTSKQDGKSPKTPNQQSPGKQNGKAKQDSQKKNQQAAGTPSEKAPQTPSTPADGESAKKKKKKKKKKNKEGADKSQNVSTASTPPTTPKAETTTSTTPKKRVVAGGTIVEDIKVGHGPEAKPGKMASVYYVGVLAKSNKRFDSCTEGKPFRFKLNQGEVIKGWDVGVTGMKVGGKRKITVPASQAYGNVKQGPIPPNSTLVFEVELKAVS